jgi:hypothetical protein
LLAENNIAFPVEKVKLPTYSPEKLKTPIQEISPSRSKIRKLNFDNEPNIADKSLRIHKLTEKELKGFAAGTQSQAVDMITDKVVPNEEGGFYQLKSSPMQKFNSFSYNPNGLSQTICQNDPKENPQHSKGAGGLRKVCCCCKKSHCLKLYCECFLSLTYCNGCKCANCMNTQYYEEERKKAMDATLVRNPTAFAPKIEITESQVIHSTLKSRRKINRLLNPLVNIQEDADVKGQVAIRNTVNAIKVGHFARIYANARPAKTTIMKRNLT